MLLAGYAGGAPTAEEDEGYPPPCCCEGEDVADPSACNAYPQLPQKMPRESLDKPHFGQFIEAISHTPLNHEIRLLSRKKKN